MEKLKIKKIAIVTTISILFFLIISILLFIKTDMFKSPNLLFGKYLLNFGTQIINFNTEPYTDIFERITNEKVEITTQAKSKYNEYVEYNEDNNILTTDTIRLDMANKNFEILYDIKNNNNEFFYMNILKKDNTYGVYIPELYDKYITLENRNLNAVAQNLGMKIEEYEGTLDNIPDTLPRIFFNDSEIKQIKEIASKYAKNIFEQVDKKLYTKEKYVIDDFYGKKIKGNKYVLTSSNDVLEEIIGNTAKELINDEELTSVLQDNLIGMAVNGIKNIIKNFAANISNEEIYNSEDIGNNTDINLNFNSYIDDSFDNTNTEENTTKNTKEIKIAVYEYKGKAIKAEITSIDGDSVEFMINNEEKINNITIKNIICKTENNDVSYENLAQLSNNFENNNGEMALSIKTTYNQEDVENLKSENSSIFLDYGQIYENTESTFKIITNIDNDVINTNFEFDMGDSLFADFFTLPKLTIKFDSNLKIKELTDEDKIVVNDYSKEDFKALKKILEAKAKERYEQKANSLVANYYKEKLETIDRNKEIIVSRFENIIDNILDEYHEELENNPNANLGDFLNVEKIKEELENYTKMIDEMVLISGNIMKVIADDNLYFIEINIDGNTLELIDIISIYVEDESLVTEDYLTESLNQQRQIKRAEEIENDKEYVYEEIKESIEDNLEAYHERKEIDENANPYDFLTIDRIDAKTFFIEEMELVDGQTIKCLRNGNTFFVKFYIDGVEWELNDIEVFYSEDGTLESAR